MKKESFWKILVMVLLLINIGTLGFLVWDRPKESRPLGKPDHLIIEGLHLDKNQIAQFEMLKSQHRQSMDSLEEIEKIIRKNIFFEIQKGDGNDTLQQENLKQIAAIRSSRDQITIAHFKDIYLLCTPEQQGYYHQTIEEFAKRLMRGKPGPRPPRMD